MLHTRMTPASCWCCDLCLNGGEWILTLMTGEPVEALRKKSTQLLSGTNTQCGKNQAKPKHMLEKRFLCPERGNVPHEVKLSWW